MVLPESSVQLTLCLLPLGRASMSRAQSHRGLTVIDILLKVKIGS